MDTSVVEWWQVVASQHSGGRHELQIKIIHFLPEELTDCGSVFQYLRLKRPILHDVSISEVQEQTRQFWPNLR